MKAKASRGKLGGLFQLCRWPAARWAFGVLTELSFVPTSRHRGEEMLIKNWSPIIAETNCRTSRQTRAWTCCRTGEVMLWWMRCSSPARSTSPACGHFDWGCSWLLSLATLDPVHHVLAGMSWKCVNNEGKISALPWWMEFLQKACYFFQLH